MAALAGPRERLVHVGALQHPETTYVLLGFQIRPVGDQHLAIRLPSQRLRLAGWAEAASQDPGTSSFHLVVELIDIAYRRFGHGGRVEVVGKVVGKQILRHDFSFYPVSIFGRAGCPAFTT